MFTQENVTKNLKPLIQKEETTNQREALFATRIPHEPLVNFGVDL